MNILVMQWGRQANCKWEIPANSDDFFTVRPLFCSAPSNFIGVCVDNAAGGFLTYVGRLYTSPSVL